KEQCNQLFDLLESIDEFAYASKAREDFVEDKMTSLKMGDTYFIEDNHEIIASVAATAESSVSAVVVAVATKENFRNKGLATALMCKLMDEYIHVKKKALCLFYDNPKAGNIYKRLGFKEMDMWVMLSKE
ncbi:MAG: GNAT family N-acetyltransferase, partial [Bacilli bacterium]|nr:GNAT family N-acetyltransferase [Bacilli bacterium]